MSPPPIRKKPVTLREIAKELGVSINTVSSVLNPRNSPVKVGATTRRAVIESARRLGYRRNAAAARMGGGQTRTIGILIDSLTQPINAPIADAFEQEVQRLGYQCFIGCTRGDGLQKIRNVERFLEHDVQGMLLTTIWDGPEVEEALKLIFDAGMPVVYADYKWERHPAPLVCGNHYQGGRLLARHLLDVGHRRFLFVVRAHQVSIASIIARISGMRDEIAAAGLDPSVLDVLPLQDQWAGGLQTASEVWARAVIATLQGPHPPSVVACGQDSAAWLLMQGLSAAGVRVPEDVAVTGYDDMLFMMMHQGYDHRSEDWSGLSIPNDLTTIRQPLREVGREAAQVLIEQIERGVKGGETEVELPDRLLDVKLITRGSSRLPERCR